MQPHDPPTTTSGVCGSAVRPKPRQRRIPAVLLSGGLQIKLQEQHSRVRQLGYVGLIDAVRDCVAHFSDDQRYMLRLGVHWVALCTSWTLCVEMKWASWPDGTVDWDVEFEAASDAMPGSDVRLEASLARHAPLRQRPALELFQVKWLLAEDGDDESSWDASLSPYPPPDGSSAAAVTGRAVIDVLHREQRKGLAER